MDCNNCNKVVPYVAHEATIASMERTINRQWITIIILIATVVCLCIGFFIYEKQFEHTTTTTTTEDVSQNVNADGTAIVAGIGDAIYGNEGYTEG